MNLRPLGYEIVDQSMFLTSKVHFYHTFTCWLWIGVVPQLPPFRNSSVNTRTRRFHWKQPGWVDAYPHHFRIEHSGLLSSPFTGEDFGLGQVRAGSSSRHVLRVPQGILGSLGLSALDGQRTAASDGYVWRPFSSSRTRSPSGIPLPSPSGLQPNSGLLLAQSTLRPPRCVQPNDSCGLACECDRP